MKFINKESIPKITKCKECALFKAHRIVSRFITKSKTLKKLFFRITYNLIVMNIIINKNRWISYVICFTTDFHLIYTHSNKIQIIETFIRTIHFIETKYENKVILVRVMIRDQNRISHVRKSRPWQRLERHVIYVDCQEKSIWLHTIDLKSTIDINRSSQQLSTSKSNRPVDLLQVKQFRSI